MIVTLDPLSRRRSASIIVFALTCPKAPLVHPLLAPDGAVFLALSFWINPRATAAEPRRVVGHVAVVYAATDLSGHRFPPDTVGMADDISTVSSPVERPPHGVLFLEEVDDLAWRLTLTERRLLASVRTLPPTLQRTLASRWAEQRTVRAHERSIFGTVTAR